MSDSGRAPGPARHVSMPEQPDINTTISRGLAWIGAASSLVWLLDIASTIIILSLWITPAQYGVAAVAVTLFRLLDLASELGVMSAVIQRDDHTEGKLSTLFWFNVAVSLVLAAVLAFALSPLLVALHGHAIIGSMLTAYGGKLVFQNTYAIPMALMRKELRFRELSYVRTLANVGEFIAKVGFAATGFGIWCFVLGPFARVVVTAVGIQLYQRWRPRLILRVREAKDWLTYGFKTAGSQILFQIYTNVDYQIVGYYFGPEANGYYKFAYDLVLDPCRIIAETIHPIGFAAYARLKYARDKLIEQFIMFTRVSIVIMVGFIGIVLVATDDLIVTFWTRDWLPAATAAKILCTVGIFRALSFVVPPLLDGIGRPGLTLTYTITASVLLPVMFWACAAFLGGELGYLSVAIAWAVGYPIAFAALAYMALGVLELSAADYLRRTWGVLASAAIAIGAGELTKLALASAASPVRLVVTLVVVIGVFLSLLAYWQGISANSVSRALKGKPPAPAGGDADDASGDPQHP